MLPKAVCILLMRIPEKWVFHFGKCKAGHEGCHYFLSLFNMIGALSQYKPHSCQHSIVEGFYTDHHHILYFKPHEKRCVLRAFKKFMADASRSVLSLELTKKKRLVMVECIYLM